MATITHGVTLNVTTNAATYTTGSVTPATNDLLVVFAAVTGSTATDWTVTDSASGTYTKIRRETKNSSGDILEVWTANQLASGSAITVTYSHASGNATGCILFVARAAGMTQTGASASKQASGQSNQAASGTPAPVFGAVALTGNPTLGMVFNATSPAGMTFPTGWTEQQDIGHSTPTAGGEYISRDSGFTGTTITWGGTSASAFGDLSIELNTASTTTTPQAMNTTIVTSTAAGVKSAGKLVTASVIVSTESMVRSVGKGLNTAPIGSAVTLLKGMSISLTTAMVASIGLMLASRAFLRTLATDLVTSTTSMVRSTGKILAANLVSSIGTFTRQIGKGIVATPVASIITFDPGLTYLQSLVTSAVTNIATQTMAAVHALTLTAVSGGTRTTTTIPDTNTRLGL